MSAPLPPSESALDAASPQVTAANATTAADAQATRRRRGRLIGEIAVSLGFAERERVEEAVSTARDEGKPTGQVLVEKGVLAADQLAQVLAERFDIDYVDLSQFDVDLGAVNLIGADAAKRYQAVPIAFLDDGLLLVAMADPTNVLTLEDISMITGMRARPAAASQEDIRMLITRLGSAADSIEDIVDDAPEEVVELETGAEDKDAPIIKLVRSLIGQAIDQGASDIHFDPEEREMRVHYRIDGVL
jgi:type IV pilus assembly protein PilB